MTERVGPEAPEIKTVSSREGCHDQVFSAGLAVVLGIYFLVALVMAYKVISS